MPILLSLKKKQGQNVIFTKDCPVCYSSGAGPGQITWPRHPDIGITTKRKHVFSGISTGDIVDLCYLLYKVQIHHSLL